MLAAGDAYTHGSFFIARIAYIAGLSILSTIDILPGRLLYCIVCIIILSRNFAYCNHSCSACSAACSSSWTTRLELNFDFEVMCNIV